LNILKILKDIKIRRFILCKFFSGVFTKTKFFWDMDLDSHEDIIQKFKLNEGDINRGFNFVRCELLPIDNNIFNHDMKNWKLSIDQDTIPEWFDRYKSEKTMKKYLKEIIDNRFALKSLREIKEGRWFIGNSAVIKYVGGSAVIKYVGDSANILNYSDYYNLENIKKISDNGMIIKKTNNKIFIKTSKGIIENIYDLINKEK
jgi:hypothetical protein